jgi:hypothetical protein
MPPVCGGIQQTMVPPSARHTERPARGIERRKGCSLSPARRQVGNGIRCTALWGGASRAADLPSALALWRCRGSARSSLAGLSPPGFAGEGIGRAKRSGRFAWISWAGALSRHCPHKGSAPLRGVVSHACASHQPSTSPRPLARARSRGHLALRAVNVLQWQAWQPGPPFAST